MDTNITLTAEEIAEACRPWQGSRNRQAIEDCYERQTDPKVFAVALSRADRWPDCSRHTGGRYGLQYAYLLQFLICDEVKRRGLASVTYHPSHISIHSGAPWERGDTSSPAAPRNPDYSPLSRTSGGILGGIPGAANRLLYAFCMQIVAKYRNI